MELENSIITSSYKVYVRCLTYNHSKFIKETLCGFAKQETSFPFVSVVIDDFSTDGEQEVIIEWMNEECDRSSLNHYELELAEVYVVKHKVNDNCTFAFYLLKQNLNGDNRKQLLIEPWRAQSIYEAICEGDDYWTYQYKLQDQVDFLESHCNYSAVSSNAMVLRDSLTSMKPFGSAITKDYTQLKEVVVHRQFHTGTVLFRTSAMRNCPYCERGQWDTFKWCCLLSQGPIHYDGNAMCVYRKQQQGVTETTRGIDWISRMSEWADIIIDCFVPQYVQRRYVVRSITREIVEVAFIKNVWKYPDNRSRLKALYKYNFSWWNVPNDLKEVLKQCAKKVLRRKTTNSGYYQ